jgi:hypothetical protein
MSQTDTRPGFRLPWTAERGDSGQPGDATTEGPPVEGSADGAEQTVEPAAEQATGTADEATVVDDPSQVEELVTPDMTDATAISASRRPTKFMADLSRAMQTAAEASRDETMARFGAEAKVAVEEIRTSSADEAAALRRRADDDVAAVREWSKAEIARIREETDSRIVARKAALDGEMDAFAAIIETRVERVNATVTEFEAEMADFFERLLAEQDPTRIATMAQAMPDPPDLSSVAAAVTEAAPRFDPTPEPAPLEPTYPPEPEAAPEGEMVGAEVGAEVVAEVAAEVAVEPEATTEPEVTTEPEAIVEPEATVEAEAEAESTPDFAAAEAEAAAFTSDLDADDGLMTLAAASDDATPVEEPAVDNANGRHASADRVTTRVVVLGLVSVASIATFKRSLGRVSGVSAIGVASGPDGEFVFTVSHDTSLALGEAITGLPGFDAKITAQTSGGLEVAAHDPDAAD